MAVPAPSSSALALGDAAIASVMQERATVNSVETAEAGSRVELPADEAPAIAAADNDLAAPAPPPAARALPSVPRKTDLQLAYHRMRAAQEAMRMHHAQGEHLAWLQRRVTALLASAADADTMAEAAHCTARVENASLSIRCDDAALAGRLERGDGDLAVFLAKLITLTAPGGEVEIAFLPAQPPVVARL